MYHTQRHAFLENTVAMISTNLHIKLNMQADVGQKESSYNLEQKLGSYAAHGGRWGSVHQPGLSSVSLNEAKYYMRY